METVRRNANSISINSPLGTIIFLTILQSCTLDFSLPEDHETEDELGEDDNSNAAVETDTASPNHTESSCDDGIQNGDETGLDCGGNCATCPGCDDGELNGDENGIDCGGSCAACPTCIDGIQNGDETGLDCGGNCAACPTCIDGIQNGDETGLDCGGRCPECGNRVFSSPTPDISIPAACFAPDQDILITKHNPSFLPTLDWVWVEDDKDWWSRMPKSTLLYQAPEKKGTYEMKFYWYDQYDEYWKSRLTFEVSDRCS